MKAFAVAAFAAFAAVALAAPAHAQRADSARTAVKAVVVTKVDSVRKLALTPPLTPGRAFLYSFLVPGLSQTKLNRPLAGGIFAFTESIGIAMLRESMADLREARRLRSDSLTTIGTDPVTGAVVTREEGYTDGLINIRKGHVEDWVAFLVGNHLFAGADAYVAAHLWDLPAQINMSMLPNGSTLIGARLRL